MYFMYSKSAYVCFSLFCLIIAYFTILFAVCRFDIEGYVTGFGNPDWAKTHEVSSRTASVVLSLVDGGAKCIGKTTIDEMAYRYRHTIVLFLYVFCTPFSDDMSWSGRQTTKFVLKCLQKKFTIRKGI